MTEDLHPQQTDNRPEILAVESILPVFQNVAPRILRWEDSFLQGLAGILGLGLGLSASFFFQRNVAEDSILANIFGKDFTHALIPGAIAAMFLWGIFICLFRWLRLRAVQKASGQGLLLAVVAKMNTPEDVKGLAVGLEQDRYLVSPLFRRLKNLIDQWLIRPSVQNADIVLQQQVNSDYENIQASYSLVRIFIWALPVLGLIGTVLGIAEAVGGFAKFLGGNVEEVSVIKKSLVGVTGGLSFAFLITLQGLVTSLLVMLIASPLQTREEKLYGAMQNNIMDLFLPKLQKILPESQDQTDPEVTTLWRDSLKQIVGNVVKMVTDSGSRILEQLDSKHDLYLQHWQERIGNAGNDFHQTALVILEKLGESGKYLLGELDKKTETQFQSIGEWTRGFRRELEEAATMQRQVLGGVCQDFDKSTRELGDCLARANEGLAKMGATEDALGQSLVQKCSHIQEVFEEHNRTLQLVVDSQQQRLQDFTAALQLQVQAVNQSLDRLSQSNLDGRLGDVVAALISQGSHLESTSQAVKELSNATRSIVESQTALQAAMRQLQELGLEKTLASFRDSLVALGPVLDGFQKPFVLQAVPVPR
jgi:biopolymer transport protein ExbB/TolQ